VTPTYHADIARERHQLDWRYGQIALARRFQALLWTQQTITLLPPEPDYRPPAYPLKVTQLAQRVAKELGTLRPMIVQALMIQVALESARQN